MTPFSLQYFRLKCKGHIIYGHWTCGQHFLCLALVVGPNKRQRMHVMVISFVPVLLQIRPDIAEAMDDQNWQYLRVVEKDSVEALACILFYALGNPITSFCSLFNARCPVKVITRIINNAKTALEAHKEVARELCDLAVQRPDVALYVDKKLFEYMMSKMAQQDAVEFVRWMGSLPEGWENDHARPMAYLNKMAEE